LQGKVSLSFYSSFCRLKLTPVIAGALLLALTNSVPEISNNLYTQVFVEEEEEQTLGISNLVGSGIFEFTIIMGIACITITKNIKMNAILNTFTIFYYLLGACILFLFLESEMFWWKVFILCIFALNSVFYCDSFTKFFV